jgi:hypothetical protein
MTNYAQRIDFKKCKRIRNFHLTFIEDRCFISIQYFVTIFQLSVAHESKITTRSIGAKQTESSPRSLQHAMDDLVGLSDVGFYVGDFFA